MKVQAQSGPDKVYTFRVALKGNKGRWRTFEILGKQTLGDFDAEIRDAFDYDTFDHLSEFYLSKVWRSEGFGEIYPDGNGPGSAYRIDSLRLVEGDRLEYVYDFGDDVQHVITLEKVAPASPADVASDRYPCMVARSKPRSRYCVTCKEKGKKAAATCVCIDCSNETMRPAYLCDSCADTGHGEHHVEDARL